MAQVSTNLPKFPVNSWMATGGGNWEQPNYWSLGIRPDRTQSLYITNSNAKIISINAETAAQYPDSLAAHSLLLTPQNTLLLDHVGTKIPFKIINDAPYYGSYDFWLEGGTVVNLNSSLFVQSLTGAKGQIFQDGGITEIGGYAIFHAEIYFTNGLFKARGYFKFAGTFNQYGGTVDCPLTLDGGTYYLYGGDFIGGARVGDSGGSFVQQGGNYLGLGLTLNSSGCCYFPPLYYFLNAGFLGSSNIYVGPAGHFTQNGGHVIVTNT